jgi:beta-glucosidase
MSKTFLTEASGVAGHFPSDFFWGAATSAYQIEGAAASYGRGPSIWDQFVTTAGNVLENHTGEIAADHYHRYQEDIAIMKEMGLGVYRFSVSWSRVLPEGTGKVNQPGLDFYDRLVDELLAQGITPMMTLYHWDLPLALHEKGGWLTRETAQAFADYAELMATHLGDRVRWWQTLNEPWCAAFLGYGIGIHAPGVKDMSLVGTVGHHLLLAHGLALPRMRARLPATAQIGITINPGPIYANDDQPATLAAVARAERSNRWFADPLFKGSYPEGLFADLGSTPPPVEPGDLALIAAPIDFLGINNYTRILYQAQSDGSAVVDPVPGAEYTDQHWEVYPNGLRDLLLWLHREYAPASLMITENGAAFSDPWDGTSDIIEDPRRLAYLRDYIQAVAEAREQGVNVTGYLVWSLLDNFEWSFGYTQRFGLVYVDYPTQRRIIKASGRWYAGLIREQRGRE